MVSAGTLHRFVRDGKQRCRLTGTFEVDVQLDLG